MTRYTAQLLDPANTARCATVIVAGHSERAARLVAETMAGALDWTVADFYPTGGTA